MATYQIFLARKAQKYLDDLMAQNLWHGDVKKLKGTDGYRRRVRNYRIVYRIDSAEAKVFVEMIDLHHRAY